MAHARGRIRGRTDRRETRWLAGIPVAVTLASLSTASLTHTLTAASLALRPFTIVRTRGIWSIESDQAVASENQQVSWGFAVVSDQAVAIGVTAVPTPETDRDSDLWLAHETLFNGFLFGDATGFNEPNGRMGELDSKAMRKVEDGQDIVSVIETSSISSGATVIVSFRMLVMLH